MADEPPRRVTTRAGDPAWLVTGCSTVKTLLTDPRLGKSHPNPQRAARYSESAIFGQARPPDTAQVEHTWMRSARPSRSGGWRGCSRECRR